MHVVDIFPVDLADDRIQRLLSLLADAYPEHDAVSRLALRAGIARADIPDLPKVRDVWPRLLDAAGRGRRLRALVELAADDPGALAFQERIRAFLADGSRPVGACPFPGRRALQPGERLFGREQSVESVRTALGGHGRVALVGPSGSGRSSLITAGLVPALDGSVVLVEGGADPCRALASAVLRALDPVGLDLAEVKRLADHLREEPGAMLTALERLERPLVVVDPIEACLEEAAALAALRAIDGAAGLVYTRLECTADPLDGRPVTVPPLERGVLERALVEPARDAGVAFETGLPARILDGVAGGGAGLLQAVALALWERREGGALTHAAFDALGGVGGVLHARADGLRLSADDWATLLQMATVADHADGAVRLETTGVESPPAGAVRHLLVVGGALGAATLTPVHPSLADWPPLRERIDADRAYLFWRTELRDELRDWERHDRDPAGLLGGSALADAQGWLARRGDDLSSAERAFIEASATPSAPEGAAPEEPATPSRWPLVAGGVAVLAVVIWLLVR